jgi:hypothetical protein
MMRDFRRVATGLPVDPRNEKTPAVSAGSSHEKKPAVHPGIRGVLRDFCPASRWPMAEC